jgi:hypothetical protein
MREALATPVEQETFVPSTTQLHAALSRAAARNLPGVRIRRIARAPCAYGSSWWLEDITLHLDDETQVTVVFKDLAREAEGSRAHRVKPAFVTDPGREPWTYRTLLGRAPGPPKLWAAGRHWLVLERVSGAPLAEVGDKGAWCAAARWLGRFHATAPTPHRGPLLRHEPTYHRAWLQRALAGAQELARSITTARGVAREKLARLRALVPAHERAIQAALATGPSLIRGEFYPSNVLVEGSAASYAVHPVDWEMSALGPPLLDLAALVSGWSHQDRAALTRAYREGAGVRSAPSLDELQRSLAACRLLLAVQWLGWAADWTAPAQHRNDWLEEAERCAEEEMRG